MSTWHRLEFARHSIFLDCFLFLFYVMGLLSYKKKIRGLTQSYKTDLKGEDCLFYINSYQEFYLSYVGFEFFPIHPSRPTVFGLGAWIGRWPLNSKSSDSMLKELCSVPIIFCSFPTEISKMPLHELTHAAWVNTHTPYMQRDLNYVAWLKSRLRRKKNNFPWKLSPMGAKCVG